MKKEDILEMSRKENKNRDLAELDVMAQAGSIAGRVGTCLCVLLSVIFLRFTKTMLCSPWIIYFSILGTTYLVKYSKIRRKSDLFLSVLFFAMGMLALGGFILRLMEAIG